MSRLDYIKYLMDSGFQVFSKSVDPIEVHGPAGYSSIVSYTHIIVLFKDHEKVSFEFRSSHSCTNEYELLNKY